MVVLQERQQQLSQIVNFCANLSTFASKPSYEPGLQVRVEIWTLHSRTKYKVAAELGPAQPQLAPTLLPTIPTVCEHSITGLWCTSQQIIIIFELP